MGELFSLGIGLPLYIVQQTGQTHFLDHAYSNLRMHIFA